MTPLEIFSLLSNIILAGFMFLFLRRKIREILYGRRYEVSPLEKAKELLAELLTEEQKEELLDWGKIAQTGKYGTYEIRGLEENFQVQMQVMQVWFRPFQMNFKPGELNSWEESAISTTRFICLSRMVKSGPWPDAVATLLLYIRSGQEIMIFRNGTWCNFAERR